jgi:hypothetical protein
MFKILLSISFLVQATSPALHSVGTGEGDVFPCIRPLDFVALALHEDKEILFGSAFPHGIADVVHQPELPALPLLCCPPFPGSHFVAAFFVGWKMG